MITQNRYNKRNSVPPDIASKVRKGDATAQLMLGKDYFNSTLVESNTDNAFKWIHQSAEQGNMEAQFRLGNFYALGHGTPKDFSAAYQWYTRAAIQGYKKALIRIHNLYQNDIKMHCRGQMNSEEEEWTNDDFKKKNKVRELNEYRLEQKKAILNGAIDYYTSQFKQYQSSNQADPVTQLNLAFLYQHGYGVGKYIIWAFEYYTLAAEQGNIDAQYNLGNLYQQHSDMKFNYREAFKWYTKSAQGGNIAAQRSLAYLYLKGLATTADYDAALSWYTKAAEAGDSEAQVILGKLYRKGDCIKQDLPNAVKWYSQAARQGNIVAQNCLSQLHQRGMLYGIELEEDMLEYISEHSMNSRLCTKLSMDISKLEDSPEFKQLNELAKHAFIGDGSAMYKVGLKYLKGDQDFIQNEDTGLKWIKNAATAKHKEAQSMMADLYKKGDSIEQDYHKAAIWCKTLAKQKESVGQYHVGILYNEGLGVRKDPLEASKWFTWAADQGNADAQYNLGILRMNGSGLRQDKYEAVKWFNKSAGQKNTNACFLLGELHFIGLEGEKRPLIIVNMESGLKLLEFAANNGYIHAQLGIAKYYNDEYQIRKNIQKSIKYLNMAVDGGNSEAQYELALIYLFGNGIDHDYVKSYNLFKQAKEKGHEKSEYLFRLPIEYDPRMHDYSKVVAMFIEITEKGIDDLHYHIGFIYEEGVKLFRHQFFDLNHIKAKEWYLAASNAGDSRADYRLGVMHENKNSINKSLKTAIKYYEKASLKENSDASYRLACMYLDGCGVTQDLLKAFHYCMKASIMGHQKANKALVISKDGENIAFYDNGLYHKGSQIRITEETKIRMLEAATKEGYTRLQYQVGVWYENKNDDSNAFKWFRLATDIGVTDAYYKLGVFYENGRATKLDYSMAANMYQKAIEKEHEDTFYRLARLYQYGNGVELDYVKAYHFYKKAADMGHVEALKILNITLKININLHGVTEENYFDPSSPEYQDSLLMYKNVAQNGDTEVQFKVGFAYEHSILKPNYVEAYKWYSLAAGNSHKKAMYHLGLLCEKGLGTPCDYQIANQLYKQAGQLGSDDAFYQLGKAYRHGNGVKIDVMKAIEYYTLAAGFGNPEYQCELGRLYEEGKAFQKNLLEALKWYTKAYLQGYNNISPKLYSIYEDKPYEDFFFKRLFRNLSIATFGYFNLNEDYHTKDYLDLNRRLGVLYLFGYGTEKDSMEAWVHFTKEYTDSTTFEVKDILFLKYNLIGNENLDILKAFVDDEAFLNQITVEHQYQLGMIFLGEVQTQSEYISIDKHGKSDARLYVIKEKDYSRAFKCLKKAADKNYIEAMIQLAVMYHCNYGENNASEQGERCFGDAAIKNIAFVGLIETLYQIPEEPQNFKLAFKWYKRVETRLDEELTEYEHNRIKDLMQLGLGLLYEHGAGVKQDYIKAIEYYKKLSMNNNCSWLHHVGLMYYYGKGVAIDYDESFGLFKRALNGTEYHEQNISNRNDSQNNLEYCKIDGSERIGESHYYIGLMYKNGQSVSQDEAKAQKYFKDALRYGCKRAKYEIEIYNPDINT